MRFHIIKSTKTDFKFFINNLPRLAQENYLPCKNIGSNLNALYKTLWQQLAGRREQATKILYQLIFQNYENKLEFLTGKPWNVERCYVYLVFDNDIRCTKDGIIFGYLTESGFDVIRKKFIRALVELKLARVKDSNAKRLATDSLCGALI